ncbi:MAG: insulinase family protein [Alphaproteobacteria bacterium]|nr:insulinase family protein [Alphaproteobacteria bacterium]
MFCGGQALAQGLFNPVTFTLDNGLQVVVLPRARVPAVVHMVWYRVGSADEQAGKGGIAHFLEHLMFKGTPSVAPGELSKIVARNGGRDNAFTNQDYTGYYQTVAADRLELVMRLESDRMANLVLTDAEVDLEREVVLEERRSRTDNQPSALLTEQMRAALFLSHNYRNPVIGWEWEIRGLTRDDALAFYRRHYAPNNAILVVAGDVTVERVRALAVQYYGPIPGREVPPRLRFQESPHQAARRLELRSEQVREPSWRRVYMAPSYSGGGDARHAYALQVLMQLLGGDNTSRLWRAVVVERAIANSASAWYDPRAIDFGSAGLFGQPRQGQTVEAVEAAIEAEIERLLRDGVTEEEVERAKRRMTASAVYALDDLDTGARLFGEALSMGRTVADVEAWPERITGVTVDQVNEAALALFDIKRSVTGILLPAAKPERRS